MQAQVKESGNHHKTLEEMNCNGLTALTYEKNYDNL